MEDQTHQRAVLKQTAWPRVFAVHACVGEEHLAYRIGYGTIKLAKPVKSPSYLINTTQQ